MMILSNRFLIAIFVCSCLCLSSFSQANAENASPPSATSTDPNQAEIARKLAEHRRELERKNAELAEQKKIEREQQNQLEIEHKKAELERKEIDRKHTNALNQAEVARMEAERHNVGSAIPTNQYGEGNGGPITGTSVSQSVAQKFIGAWAWFNPNGSMVEIKGDGTAVHLENNNIIDHGKWTALAEGVLRLSWKSGYSDEWRLSRDGSSMSGSNQYNALPTVFRR